MKSVISMSGIGSRPCRKNPCVGIAIRAAYLPAAAPDIPRARPKMARAGPARSRREDAPRAGGLHAAAVHDDGAIDDDVGDAPRVAMGIGEGRLVLDGPGIEDREVGGVALTHEPPVPQAKPRGAHPR